MARVLLLGRLHEQRVRQCPRRDLQELCKAGLIEIGGAFSGETTITPPGSRWTWNGTVAFERLGGDDLPGAFGTYSVAPSGGVVTYVASGNSPNVACQMSGTKQFDIPPGSGSIPSSEARRRASTRYTIRRRHLHAARVADGGHAVLLQARRGGPGGHEGDGLPGGLPWDTGQEQYSSEDGREYIGTRSQAQGGVSYSWSWAFAGG